MGLTRSSTGLLANYDFSTLSGWTAGAHFSVATDQPHYACFPSTIVFSSPTSVSADAGGMREATPWKEDGRLWVFFDGASGSAPWTIQLLYSDDGGVTKVKLGNVAGLNHGSYTGGRDMGGFIYKHTNGKYYIYVLNAAALFDAGDGGNTPAPPYTGSTYSLDTVNGSVTWVADEPLLGASDEFDGLVAAVSSILKVDSEFNCYYSANVVAANGYGVGRATATGPTGMVKDGAGNILPSAVCSATQGRPENPKVFQPSAMPGLTVMLANCVDPTGNFTSGNDGYYSTSYSNWSSSYRVEFQRDYGFDSNGRAIGLLSPIWGSSNFPVAESDGSMPAIYDADPTDHAPGYHIGRDLRQAQLEPCLSEAKFSGTSGVEYLTRAFATGDFVAEYTQRFQDEVGHVAICYRMTQSGGVDDAHTTAYIMDIGNGGPGVGDVVTLYKCVAGSFTSLGTAARHRLNFVADSRNSYKERLRIVVSGTSHKVYLDDATVLLSITDASIASGALIGFRCASDSGNATLRLGALSIRSSDAVTISGLPASAAIVLRGAGSVVFATGTADGSGNATISSHHFPMYSVGVNGTDYTIGATIHGGDVLLFAPAVDNGNAPIQTNLGIFAALKRRKRSSF